MRRQQEEEEAEMGRDGEQGRWDGVAKSGGGRRVAVPMLKNQGQDTGMNDEGDKTKAHTSLSDRLRATGQFSFRFSLFRCGFFLMEGDGL